MRVAICGAGGFIGGHLVNRLVAEGHAVRAYDIKLLKEWHQINPDAQNYASWDLREDDRCRASTINVDRVYNLAADMGGMGFIENHKLDCMLSVLISTNLLRNAAANGVIEFFYASSACVYPGYRQDVPEIDPLRESDAYPADPEDGYGWEKLFGERLCRHYADETEMTTRVARFHNIYGTRGTWQGGREKAPAAICRKVAESKLTGSGTIDVWGDGYQTRSFCYVDDAVEGVQRLMASDFDEPVNIGSAETVTINQLVDLVEEIAEIKLNRTHDEGAPQGVRGRSSNNTLCQGVLGWEPSITLRDGMTRLYEWVEGEVKASLA